ncbi:hypothetical protein [Kribbella sp. NPDC051718]|uniref:hypothetical protein n=1 Tax=Kribbella sp. NPDC051718 TaxID=3155168 RepID=UPI003437E588
MAWIDWDALGSLDRERSQLAERRKAWRDSAVRRRVWTLSFILCGVALVVGLAIGFLFAIPLARFFLGRSQEEPPGLAAGTLTVGLICFGLAGLSSAVWIRLAYVEWLDELLTENARNQLRTAQANIGSIDQMAEFGALWEVTQKRLDYYHRIATSQAEKSFHNARRAILFGLAFIVVCAFLAAATSSTPAAVVVGVLGVSGGGLAGYIGSTFLRMQESTGVQLKEYFHQPLEFSKILAAERLLMKIEDTGKRADAMQAVAQSIAAGRYRDGQG